MSKRKIEVLIISDIHLGTYGASAKELNAYLRSIDPQRIIINGDWLDIWNFDANYWPTDHTENIFLIFDFIKQGKPVQYLTGNHDEALRGFSNYNSGTFELIDELELVLDGKKHWIFHGDIFDESVSDKAKWLAKLGGQGYDFMVRLNRNLNNTLVKFGRDRIMISKTIKDNVKKIVKSQVSDFEQIACERAIEKGVDFAICGHIHKPQMRRVTTEKGSVMYLNSGDWVESCTALEYNNGKWSLFSYYDDFVVSIKTNKSKKHKEASASR